MCLERGARARPLSPPEAGIRFWSAMAAWESAGKKLPLLEQRELLERARVLTDHCAAARHQAERLDAFGAPRRVGALEPGPICPVCREHCVSLLSDRDSAGPVGARPHFGGAPDTGPRLCSLRRQTTGPSRAAPQIDGRPTPHRQRADSVADRPQIEPDPRPTPDRLIGPTRVIQRGFERRPQPPLAPKADRSQMAPH